MQISEQKRGRWKKVIVTGGAGFIGSHLTKSLVKRGYRIIVLDDLSTGKMANLEGLLERQNADPILFDVRGVYNGVEAKQVGFTYRTL